MRTTRTSGRVEREVGGQPTSNLSGRDPAHQAGVHDAAKTAAERAIGVGKALLESKIARQAR
jgi:hypothetical protein